MSKDQSPFTEEAEKLFGVSLKKKKKTHSPRKHGPSHAGGEEGSDEVAWLTSYADMMTVLCCFFILLVSMANFDPVQFGQMMEKIAEHFSPETMKKLVPDVGISKTKTKEQLAENNPHLLSAKEAENQKPELDKETNSKASPEEKKQMSTMLADLKEYADVSKTTKIKYDNGLEIVFTATSLFESGSPAIDRDMNESLDMIVGIIKSKGTNFPIVIEGHTDGNPFTGNSIYPSNWELSAARAAYVLRKFEKAGIPKKNLVALGYGDSRPQYPEFNGLGKPIPENQRLNRRVVIKVLYPHQAPKDKIGLGVFFSE